MESKDEYVERMARVDAKMRSEIRWRHYFMDVASLTADLSYCKELKVGAVAVRDKRIICTGFNGTLPGADNCCEECVGGVVRTKDDTEHAERNLIGHAAKHGIALLNSDLYVTHAPCVVCARAIIIAGFASVSYRHEYKSNAGIELLKTHNIPTLQRT